MDNGVLRFDHVRIPRDQMLIRVFRVTMGSPVYGQLGNPQADGKLPTRVDRKLAKSFMEEMTVMLNLHRKSCCELLISWSRNLRFGIWDC